MSDTGSSLVEKLRAVANPFGQAKAATTGLVEVEQSRAVAEIQAAMVVARASPRDPIRAMDLVLQDCMRPKLAEAALYAYTRGGTEITGPSIRLAEALARRWGNIECGVRELSRGDGYSECVAYAWDLESNFRDTKTFQIRHWRDTKSGGYALKDERDIYELIANQGARRKRASILAVLPGDVVEAAQQQCEETLKASADTSKEAVQKMVAAFSAFGVTKDHIEQRIQRRLDSILPAQVIHLRKIYTSIKDGMSTARDWFSIEAETAETTAKLKETLKKKTPKQEVDHTTTPDVPPGDIGADESSRITTRRSCSAH